MPQDRAIEELAWALVASAVVAALAVPVAAAWFRRRGIRDDERSLRKIHGRDVPRAGGVAVVATVLVGVAVAAGLGVEIDPTQWAVVGAATVLGAVGVADDLVGLRARTKLAAQVLCAVAVIAAGLHWQAAEALFERNWFSLGLTVGFFVAAVNAVNLIDGLDGLAAGVVLAASSVVLGGGVLGTAPADAALVAALAAGATLGFLAHNRPPARVFLGDGGAYFLGFLVAAELLLVDSVRPRKAVVELSIPVLAFGLPLLDTALAVVRRLARGQPVFAPDADHVHHRLLARGIDRWRAVLVLWALAAWFAAMALLTVAGVGGSTTVAGALLAAMAFPVALGYHRGMVAESDAGPADEGWRARRRRVVEVLGRLDDASREVEVPAGPKRWQALEGPVFEVAELLGAVAVEVRDGSGRPVVRGGRPEGVRLRLAVELREAAELRFGFTSAQSLAGTAASTHVVERLVAVLLDETDGPRRSRDPVETFDEEDEEGPGTPAPRAAAADGGHYSNHTSRS